MDGKSAPNVTQQSTNLASNDGLIGGGRGEGTMIGDGWQSNRQAIDSNQVAEKGKQTSVDVESGTQIIGLGAGDAIIGSTGQASDQAKNSLQTGAGHPGAGTLVVLGPTNKGPLSENSLNLLVSCQLVIGGPAGSC